MTEVTRVTLEDGSSYWIGFRNNRGSLVRVPMTVVKVGPMFMGQSYDGKEVFALPKNIDLKSTQKMRPFQELNWKANSYKRANRLEEARIFKERAYAAMPDQWYLDRINKMTEISDRYYRGDRTDPHIEVAIAELRQYRPDLDADSLVYVKRQMFDLDALLQQLTSPVDNDERPTLARRVSNFFRSLVRR